MAKTIIFTFENTNPKILIDNNGSIISLIDNHENLFDLITLLNHKLVLNLDESNEMDLVRTAYEKASEGIAENPGSYMDYDLGDKSNFGLTNYIQQKLEDRLGERDNFKDYGDLKEEVLEELEKNQSLDILAYLVDEINLVMISKVIELYNSQKASKVRMNDTIGLVRLQELLSREMAKLGIDLMIN